MAKDMYQKRKERQNKSEEIDNKTNINWYPGHMAKTKKEISANLGLIDVVYELIDARIPISSKNKEINDLIKNKPRILIMTKSDLCDINKTNKCKLEYEKYGYKVVLVDLIKKDNIKEILKYTNEYAEEINAKRKEKGMLPKRTRILILGIPNVGKSTLINALVGKKATNVGNKPGITKKLEWIRINKDLELLDTPGILWPKLDNDKIALNLASMSAIKEEVLDNEEVAIYIIKKLLLEYPNSLKERYNISNEKDIVAILDLIGKKIGAIKNNETDYDKVYQTIIKDLKEGYLGKVNFD